jgi:hypothetical protein
MLARIGFQKYLLSMTGAYERAVIYEILSRRCWDEAPQTQKKTESQEEKPVGRKLTI